ncbi:hypothetical protein pb186bvf_004829 [Paramecium bursaria]
MIETQRRRFKNLKFSEVKFKIGDEQYEMDLKYMIWKMTKIQAEEQKTERNDEQKNKRNRQSETKRKYDENLKLIQDLDQEIQRLQEQLEHLKIRYSEEQLKQENLVKVYIHEHQETERVKAAKEKLEKLKRELGL